jgi:nitroreductase
MTADTTIDTYESLERLMLRQRAIRIFDTTRPVEDAVIERAIRVATFAPNGGNRQPARFIAVRDRETKRALGAIFDEIGATMTLHTPPERTPWEDVPVLVALVAEQREGTDAASIYPAVQNFLLSVQGQGLGSVLTTRWRSREPEVKTLLGLPENWDAYAILPVGWPARKYGRGSRLPVAEVTYRERFGQPWTKG